MAPTSPENHILAVVPTWIAELKALAPRGVDVGPSFFRTYVRAQMERCGKPIIGTVGGFVVTAAFEIAARREELPLGLFLLKIGNLLSVLVDILLLNFGF